MECWPGRWKDREEDGEMGAGQTSQLRPSCPGLALELGTRATAQSGDAGYRALALTPIQDPQTLHG